MSAETFTTALFLITAVIAAGVLINAVFPVVYTMAGTFQSSTHESDVRLRTDFKIVAAFGTAGTPGTAQVWMKNIGSQKISTADILRSDVFFGLVGNINRADTWTYDIVNLNSNTDWDPGETLHVTVSPATLSSEDMVYFQFVLPNGIWRSNEFTVS